VNLNPADTSYGEQVLDPALRRRYAHIAIMSRTTNSKACRMQAFQWAILGSNQ
jgi:hypothetical protein